MSNPNDDLPIPDDDQPITINDLMVSFVPRHKPHRPVFLSPTNVCTRPREDDDEQMRNALTALQGQLQLMVDVINQHQDALPRMNDRTFKDAKYVRQVQSRVTRAQKEVTRLTKATGGGGGGARKGGARKGGARKRGGAGAGRSTTRGRRPRRK